jgi:hypothetical protein
MVTKHALLLSLLTAGVAFGVGPQEQAPKMLSNDTSNKMVIIPKNLSPNISPARKFLTGVMLTSLVCATVIALKNIVWPSNNVSRQEFEKALNDAKTSRTTELEKAQETIKDLTSALDKAKANYLLDSKTAEQKIQDLEKALKEAQDKGAVTGTNALKLEKALEEAQQKRLTDLKNAQAYAQKLEENLSNTTKRAASDFENYTKRIDELEKTIKDLQTPKIQIPILERIKTNKLNNKDVNGNTIHNNSLNK